MPFKKNKFAIYAYALISSTLVIQCFYLIQVRYVFDKPYLGIGLFAPIIVGAGMGLLIGKLTNQHLEIKRSECYKSLLENQKILNEVLLLSKKESSLISFLDKVLKIIISAPFTNLEQKGGIFLKQSEEKYFMVSAYNLEPQIINHCGKAGIKPGECLCGQSILKKKSIYAPCVNHDHTFTFEGMKDHGHYNVPIMYDENVLGVLVLYLDINHKYNKDEIEFLESIADLLALVIHKDEHQKLAKERDIAVENAINLTGLATWQFHLDSGEVKWNDKVYEYLGYEAQSKTLDMEFLDGVIHPDDKLKYKNAVKNAKLGTPFQLEIRFIDRHKEIRYTINKCTPQLDIDGNVKKLDGIIFDITDLKVNKYRLDEKDNFIESIVSASPFSLSLLDIEKNEILYTNAQFDKSVNKKACEAFKVNGLKIWNDFIHPDDVYLFTEVLEKIKLGNKPLFELNARFAYDGENYRWVNQRFTSYKTNKQGKITHLLTVGIDIQKQKKADDNILKLNKELNEQNEELIKTHTELDNFIYSSAHDLRAPIASILGLTNIYTLESEQKLKDEYISHIEFTAKKLDNVIHEILQYARNSKIELEVEEIEIGSLINNVYENLKFAYLNKEYQFELINPDNIKIFSDGSRIRMILNIILNNALKYRDKSKNVHLIRCTLSKKQNGINIRIYDNGIGIGEDYLHRIFDMFYRATNSSTGSGLGLYIAKESVSKIAGIIDINSSEGKYTEVDIYLPNLSHPINIH